MRKSANFTITLPDDDFLRWLKNYKADTCTSISAIVLKLLKEWRKGVENSGGADNLYLTSTNCKKGGE